MAAAEGEEIAVLAVFLVGALGENALCGILLIGREDFCYLFGEQGVEGFCIFGFEVCDFFLLLGCLNLMMPGLFLP